VHAPDLYEGAPSTPSTRGWPTCRRWASRRSGPPASRCRCTAWTPTRVFAGEGDLEAARALVEEADDAELFLYPGDVHLFADPSLPTFDGEAASALTHRVLELLDRV